MKKPISNSVTTPNLVDPTKFLTAAMLMLLVGTPKLVALYAEYIRWATEVLGKTLVEAQANIPDLTNAKQRHSEIRSGMRASDTKDALAPLDKGLHEDCIFSPLKPSWNGYANHKNVKRRYFGSTTGLQCDHLCENRACINTLHIIVVPKEENMARAKVAKKTHCGRGHDLETHGRTTRLGEVVCKTCTADWQRARRMLGTNNTGTPSADKTHCKNGHEFTPENTHIQYGMKDGKKVFRKRRCRACSVAEYQRRADAAKLAAAPEHALAA